MTDAFTDIAAKLRIPVLKDRMLNPAVADAVVSLVDEIEELKAEAARLIALVEAQEASKTP